MAGDEARCAVVLTVIRRRRTPEESFAPSLPGRFLGTRHPAATSTGGSLFRIGGAVTRSRPHGQPAFPPPAPAHHPRVPNLEVLGMHPRRSTTHFRVRLGTGLLIIALPLVAGGWASAQMTPEQAAEMLLDGARRAYNERNYPFAVTRFREFLAKYGNHKNAPSARYGLALALLDSPDRDYQGALEQLQPLAGNKDFADAAFVPYYLGVAQRGLGMKELAQAAAKPQEATQRRAAGN